ncbi:MAG: DUF3298 domain-containing protein [Clostridia bacterium]|nr:DUF3298 domain-containing protein [Clostridia bacterium]
MKRIIFLASLLILAVLFCSCKNTTVPEVPAESVEVSDVTVKDEIFSEKTEFDVGVCAEVYITAPKVEAPDYGDNVKGYNQMIDTIIGTVKSEYEHDVAIGQSAEGAAATSRMLTYEVFTAKDGYISVMIKVDTSIAGAVNPTSVYKCISYDLKAGKLLSLQDVVGEDKITQVKANIIEQMKQHPEKFYSVEDNALDDVDLSYSFLEDEEYITVVIDQYVIAPRSYGAQIFEILKTSIG